LFSNAVEGTRELQRRSLELNGALEEANRRLASYESKLAERAISCAPNNNVIVELETMYPQTIEKKPVSGDIELF